jgi:hypothetical protein
LAPLIRPILPARAGSTRARRLFDGKPKDGKAEEMAADTVDGKPKDGGLCQITGSGGYKAWILCVVASSTAAGLGLLEVLACLSCLRLTNVDG